MCYYKGHTAFLDPFGEFAEQSEAQFPGSQVQRDPDYTHVAINRLFTLHQATTLTQEYL